MSFIGYPPVLDAVVTLLTKEKNYHKLLIQIENSGGNDVEIEMLFRIASYILQREKEQKVDVNILKLLIDGMPQTRQEYILNTAFGVEEQCIRLVAHCLNKEIRLQAIAEPVINEKYEEQLRSLFEEHPFITGRRFRNAVFESVALATLMASESALCNQLVSEYLSSQKYSYHLVYLLSLIARDKFVSLDHLHILIGSALEFFSTSTSVEVSIDGPDIDEHLPAQVSTEIEILFGHDRSISKVFAFRSNLANNATIVNLGGRLASTYVTLPCQVIFTGKPEVEITAPVDVSAETIIFQAQSLILKHAQQKGPDDKVLQKKPDDAVLLQSRIIQSHLEGIITNGVPLTLAASDTSGLTYPSIQYAKKINFLPNDPQLGEKYIRLRRILMEFRSHSKGSLARIKHKIEHNRVLKNNNGRIILNRLLSDKILTLSGLFYHLQPDNLTKHLDVSWLDLRLFNTSEKLLSYLRSIDV